MAELTDAQKDQAISKAAVMLAEDQIEVIEDGVSLLKRIIWNHRTHVGVAFVAGAGLGGVVTYHVTKSKLQYRFEETLASETERIKEHYSRKNFTGDYADPETAAQKLIPEEEREVAQDAMDAFQTYKPDGEGVVGEVAGIEEAEDVIRDEVKKARKRTIFENSVEDFDWDEETAYRESLSDADPFVITLEEYDTADHDDEWEQKSLTYYEKDGILTLEDDTVVSNVDSVVGPLANLRFGYGSKDSNMVYVRNPRITWDMEISRHTGSYEVAVLGLDDSDEKELKHHVRPGQRKFRSSDE